MSSVALSSSSPSHLSTAIAATTPRTQPAKLVVASTKDDLITYLNQSIVSIAIDAIADHNGFTVALSGGSLPTFLSTLATAFGSTTVDPQWSKWHIVLADERCVPLNDEESNLASIQQSFIRHTGIPPQQVYGINQDRVATLVENATSTATIVSDIAMEYETTFKTILTRYSGGYLDLAVLGFGPDGHTCSLFPHHPLVQERSLWVAPIIDSPKAPSNRITLTFPVLNHQTRHVIVCGAGSSKQPIIRAVFENLDMGTPLSENDGTGRDKATMKIAGPNGTTYTPTMKSSTPYPSAMVQPLRTLTWLIDTDAMNGE